MKGSALDFLLETSLLHLGNHSMTENRCLQGTMQPSVEPCYRPVMVQTANMGNPPPLSPETAALQHQDDFPINAVKISLLQLLEPRETLETGPPDTGNH